MKTHLLLTICKGDIANGCLTSNCTSHNYNTLTLICGLEVALLCLSCLPLCR